MTTAPTDRTRIHRVPERASYDSATLHAIIDAAYLCHVAFSDEKGTHCIPTVCWRQGNHLVVHGSNGSRLVKLLAAGAQACVTVTHLDALVLARAAFNHTMNYRSAMVYGSFERVEEEADKRASMAALMDKIAIGRQAQVRPGNDKEFAATTILRLALTEAVCKVRSGGPHDSEEDMDIPVWTGALPFGTRNLAPVPDEKCSVAAPDYVTAWAG